MNALRETQHIICECLMLNCQIQIRRSHRDNQKDSGSQWLYWGHPFIILSCTNLQSLAILFTQMLIIKIFHSYRLFWLGDTGQRGMEWIATVSRGGGGEPWALTSTLLWVASVLLQWWFVWLQSLQTNYRPAIFLLFYHNTEKKVCLQRLTWI
jgi:hypothetical protein